MAFTAAGGGEQLPPANLTAAGELPSTGRPQNRLNYVHQVHSKTSNNPPAIHHVLGPTGKSFKFITSPTNHLNPDRQNRAAKTRKNPKSSSRFLPLHRPESETSSLALSDTSFKFKSSSLTHLSPDRSEKPTKTAKQFQSSSRFASPTSSETEVPVLPTGNGVELPLSSTQHQPFPDLPLSPSGTSVKKKLHPKPRYDVFTAAAKNLERLPAMVTSAAQLNQARTAFAATAGAAAGADGARVGHDGASSSAGAANAAAGVADPAANVLERPLPAAAKLNRAGTNHAETATFIAAAAGAELLPRFATQAHGFAVHPSALPAISKAAKGKEKQQLRPALIMQNMTKPYPVPLIPTRTHDPFTQSQVQAQTRNHDPSTHTRNITHTLDPSTQTHDPSTETQIQQPKAQHPAHNPTPNFSQTHTFTETSSNPPKPSYASITTPGSTLKQNAPPPPPKSFSDVVSEAKDSTIPLNPASLIRGEPAVIFSTEEIAAMAEPFKLALIGKFSFGRPSMDIIRKFFISLGLKGTSHISLLDNRHILITLSLEADYSRIWVRQSWYVNGRGMRIFKWSKDFRCSEESPIVPVWVSLPYLPVHFIHCKAALYSIAAAIGTPLRVDNATATVSRPSVARILVEYDISQPLLPRLWIGEGASGFWQDVVFERVPAFCSSCRHLGHSPESCFITNPELRKAPQSTATPPRPAPECAQPAASAATHPRQDPTLEGVHIASEIPPATHLDGISLLGPPVLRVAPVMTPEQPSLAIQIVDSGSPITVLCPVDVDSPDSATTPDSPDMHPDDPSSEATSVDRETSDGVQSRDDTETRVGVELSDDALIEKLGAPRIFSSSEGFVEVSPRRSFNINRIRRHRRRCS